MNITIGRLIWFIVCFWLVGCDSSTSSDERRLDSLSLGGAAMTADAVRTPQPSEQGRSTAEPPVSAGQPATSRPSPGPDAGGMTEIGDATESTAGQPQEANRPVGGQPSASWVSLNIEQSDVMGPVGDEIQLSVMGTLDDGTRRRVEEGIEWSTNQPNVATVDESGLVRLVGMGMTSIQARVGSQVSGELMVVAECDYPQNTGAFVFGEPAPPVVWNNAYRPDGSQYDFGLAQFYCGPKYADANVLILMVGAGWCGPCSNYTQNVLNPIAEDLIAAGAEIVYVEAEDSQYRPASSRFAFQHLRVLIGDGPGIRVGDADSYLMDEFGERTSVPSFVQEQSLLEAFPSVWVLRKRDMRLIADQNRSNFYLPLRSIADDPERDWSQPPPPPFVSNCEPGEDEELTETVCDPEFEGLNCQSDDQCNEPAQCDSMVGRCTQGICDGDCELVVGRCLNRNDSIYSAQTLSFDVDLAGGICNREPDFYRIIAMNRWRVTLQFSHDEGDLDVYLWDKETDTIKLDENNRRIGSYGVENIETFEGDGPAYISVIGYNRSSANYTLRVEELME